jgi:hypothetical protein
MLVAPVPITLLLFGFKPLVFDVFLMSLSSPATIRRIFSGVPYVIVPVFAIVVSTLASPVIPIMIVGGGECH